MLSTGIPNEVAGSVWLMPLAKTTIGERIRQAREALGYTDVKRKRAEFARLLGIKPSSLAELENGASGAPSAETLMRMRREGINPEYVMHGTGDPLLDLNASKDADDQELLRHFHDLDPALRASVIRNVRLLVEATRRPFGGFGMPSGGDDRPEHPEDRRRAPRRRS